MKRTLVTILVLAVFPGLAAALGLGKIELNSALNQPLDARIELLSPTAEEIQSLKVGLADSDAFRRAGIDRPFSLSKLEFTVKVNDTGSDYIHITSQEPIREPFLNFLVEANWSSGRLFREYTVLLDPPMYDPNARRVAPEPEKQAAETGGGMEMQAEEAEETPEAMPERARREAPSAEPSAAPSGTTYGGDYGPTVTNDTLWSIAKAERPDESVSIQQMMLALLRANPEAFIDNNINGLKRGYVLRMPDEEAINRLNKSEALSQVKSQYALWDQARGMMADRAGERPAGTPGAGEAAAGGAAAAEDESELRLVTPEEGGAGQTEAGAGTGELRNKLAMANEQLESLASENQDLKDRLSESDAIISDLKRLIALKDDELARLQQQLAAEGAAAEQPAAQEAAPEKEQEAAEPEPEKAGPEKKPEPAPAAEEPAPAPAGIIETVRGMVMDNLMILGAVLALVLLAIIGLAVVRRRAASGSGAAEEAAVPGDLEEDFAESEAETELPPGSEDETDFGVSAGGEEVGEATAEEATVIAETGEPSPTEAPAEEMEQAQAEEEEPSAGDEEEEEDPLAEVNVFLAYEHFDQAEEFVRDAIKDKPDNLDFHSKLLEVFYAAGDKAKYEEEARVLHDMVNGEGEYWDMALAMWQEMSPNRALFEEPAEGEEDEDRADTTGGGIVDLTADESGGADAGLDFDLGMDEEATGKAGGDDDEDVLDITSGAEEEGDNLERTASESDEDILDITAAVGLESEDDDEEGGSGGGGDLLDVSSGGGDSEDLLDVTTSANLEGSEVDEDLLDVTSATGAGADSDELLEVGSESGGGEESGSEDNSLDFDIGGLEDEAPTEEKKDEGGESAPSAEDDNSLDFDIGGLDLESGKSEDSDKGEDKNYHEGDTLDLHGAGGDNVVEFGSGAGKEDESSGDEDSGLELNLEADESAPEAEAGGEDEDLGISLADDEDSEEDKGPDEDLGLSLDVPDSGGGDGDEDQGLELDLSAGDESTAEAETDKDKDDDFSFDLEIEEDEPSSGSAKSDLDMEETVELPKGGGDEDMDTLDLSSAEFDDEEGGDATVFVPRSSDSDEQSAEDEIATRLDLAKAYVELGDNDSAKSILEEIIAEGNDEQRQQARDLMNQMS